MKVKWKRISAGWRALMIGDTVVAVVRQMDQCRRWFPYIGEDADFPDGTAFTTMREAKIYVQEEIISGRLGHAEAVAVKEEYHPKGGV